jgi:hypothetical protein
MGDSMLWHKSIKKILDTKYKPADLNKIAHNCDYLTDDQMQLLSLLHTISINIYSMVH